MNGGDQKQMFQKEYKLRSSRLLLSFCYLRINLYLMWLTRFIVAQISHTIFSIAKETSTCSSCPLPVFWQGRKNRPSKETWCGG